MALNTNSSSSSTAGLSSAEVTRIRSTAGWNDVPEKHVSPLLRLLKRFWGPVPWMLEAAIIVTAVLAKWDEVGMISGLLCVNAVLAFVQEHNAAKAINQLKARLQVSAKVFRDCAWALVPARELVPGDLIRLRAGDAVPADAAVVDGFLLVDQSSMTGESGTVEQTVGNLVASGSMVKKGEASLTVKAIGSATMFGKTVSLVRTSLPPSHMGSTVARVALALSILAVAVSLSILIVVAATHQPVVDALPLVIMVLVSGIPSALPALFTISSVLGAHELARQGVLIAALAATEDAACMTVMCVDKTGTLTQNVLTIAFVVVPDGGSPGVLLPFSQPHAPPNSSSLSDVSSSAAAPPSSSTNSKSSPHSTDTILRAAALACAPADLDPIDVAIVAAAGPPLASAGWRTVEFLPFDPSTRRTEAVVERTVGGRTERMRCVKGSPLNVARMCSTGPSAAAGAAGATASGATALPVTGPDVHIPVSGPDVHISVSGPDTHISVSGRDAHIPVSGPDTHVSVSGPDTHISVSGPDTHICVSGPDTHAAREAWISAAADALAMSGCRALAVASTAPYDAEAQQEKQQQQPLLFMGLLGIRDPPRPDSATAVAQLHALGVRVLLLTGDSIAVARAIAAEVGIGGNVVSAPAVEAAAAAAATATPAAVVGAAPSSAPITTTAASAAHIRLSGSTAAAHTVAATPQSNNAAATATPSKPRISTSSAPAVPPPLPPQLSDLYSSVDGLAEVQPQHKHAVVSALQSHGHVVGMTGDGVNDAPALAQAEVGVAVSTATDAAKGAARVILTAPGLSGIAPLITVSRRIHARIATWIINKFAKELLQGTFIAVAYFATGAFVVNAFQLVLLLLLIDFVTLSISTDSEVGSLGPDTWNITALCGLGITVGVCGLAESLGLLYFAIRYLGYTAGSLSLQTFCFQLILYASDASLLSVRERLPFYSSRPSVPLALFLACNVVVALVVSSVGGDSIAPIPVWHSFVILAWVTGFTFLVNDAVKVVYVRAFLTQKRAIAAGSGASSSSSNIARAPVALSEDADHYVAAPV